MKRSTPTIAVAGMMLESNAFAPVATETDFRAYYYFEGEALRAELDVVESTLPTELCGFVETMSRTGPWTLLPTVITGCQPTGPVDSDFLEQVVDAIVAGLEGIEELDGVYVANHGAMVATRHDDADGYMLSRIRDSLGDSVPIVCTLDLHANVSDAMVDSTNALIGYRTNPHVDMYDRGREAALVLRELIAGESMRQVHVKLPLVPPSVTLLTAAGPYADTIDFAARRQRELAGAIVNASVLGNFAFSDSASNGISVVVTGRDSRSLVEDQAHRLANEIASFTWERRQQFVRKLMSIDEAVSLAELQNRQPKTAPVMFSDAGDNPGGGGLGNTTWLLTALAESDARSVLYGSFFDPELAVKAHEAGEGNEFRAVFNAGNETEFSKSLTCEVKVLQVFEGHIVGRRGIAAGRKLRLGRAALLELNGPEGIRVVVMSVRHQTADPMFFEIFGVAANQARTVVVKSRGHFRAGFDEWFGPSQIFEVDTPGLTAPILDRFNWQRLPRPVFPLDNDVSWAPS